jgi:hypothetical protein
VDVVLLVVVVGVLDGHCHAVVERAETAQLQVEPFEDGMAEEMRFHIEAYTQDLVRSGLSPEEA